MLTLIPAEPVDLLIPPAKAPLPAEIVDQKCPGCGADADAYTGSPPHGPRCPYK